MEIIETPSQMKALSKTQKESGKSIGFVPTMGALHVGHLSLVKRAKQVCDVVVVSVFVNPTQFGKNEDLDKYPRDIVKDSNLCELAGADYLFHPSANDIYGNGEESLLVSFPELSNKLCGKFRPGHFDGVTTIMAKLLSIVSPDSCFMGKKDGQQLSIVQRLARDLFISCEIIGCPTVREKSGLALSSRNSYMSEKQRADAGQIFASLSNFTIELLKAIDLDEKFKIQEALDLEAKHLQSGCGFEVQYFDFVDRNTFEPVREIKAGEFMICTAVLNGTTRLIDNFTININEAGKLQVDAGVDEMDNPFTILSREEVQS